MTTTSTKNEYKLRYRVLDDTYGRIRRFWYTADTRFASYEEAENYGAKLLSNPNIDAYKVVEPRS